MCCRTNPLVRDRRKKALWLFIPPLLLAAAGFWIGARLQVPDPGEGPSGAPRQVCGYLFTRTPFVSIFRM
jgi:hypothetical protein